MPLPRRAARIALAAMCAFFALVQPAVAAWVWPTSGELVTPYRNVGDPYAAGQHRGIDIAAPPGAPVVAAVAGVVRFAGSVGSSGLTVGIRTADGRYDTSYLHLSAIAVREGQRLAAGERLGAAGSTGLGPGERPHVHFGVRDAGSRFGYRDPLGFLPPRSSAPRERPAPGPVALRDVRAPSPGAAPAPAERPLSWGPAPRAAPLRSSGNAGDLAQALVLLGLALAAALLARTRAGAGLPRRSSIGGPCPTTSRRPSTT